MDTFRILMVLPSVFTRGWDHFGRKIGPPGGGPETPFLGSGGYPPTPPPPPPGGGPPPPPPLGGAPPGGAPTPPRGGSPPPPPCPGGGVPPPPPGGGRPAGGVPGPPRGGYPPLPRGGETPAKKDPPLGYPKFMHKFMTQIRVKKLRKGKRVIDFLHTLPYLVSVDYYVENYTYHSDVFSSSSFIFLSSEISD